MLFGSKKVIGLDIGTSSIKMAELDVGRTGATMVSFGFAPSPIGAMNGGEINDPNSVTLAIRNLLNELRSKRKFVSTGMWGTAVIVKKITIPRIEKKLIADQIKWEAEQYIPFDINDISLAYHVVSSAQSADTMDLLLVAAQNELVNQYKVVVQGAGLQLSVLDVNAFALANTFEMNYGKRSGETNALINVGAGVTNFVVVNEGSVVFSRDIPIGGMNYTSEIQKEMGVSTAEAESLKLSAVSRREVPDEVHSVISATNEMMTEEIRNSFDFFSASNAGLMIQRAFYSGGSSTIPGLVQQMSTATGVSAEVMNPFAKIKAAKNFSGQYLQQIAPFASVVLGLALRKEGDA